MQTGSSSSGQAGGTFPGWTSNPMMGAGGGQPMFGFNPSGGPFAGAQGQPMMTGNSLPPGTPGTPEGSYGDYGGPAAGVYPSGGGTTTNYYAPNIPSAPNPITGPSSLSAGLGGVNPFAGGGEGGAGVPSSVTGPLNHPIGVGLPPGYTGLPGGGGAVQWGPASGNVAASNMPGLMPLIHRLVGAMG